MPAKKLLRSITALFIFSALALASCLAPALSSDMQVTFKTNEKWEAKMEIVFDRQTAQLVGSEIDKTLNKNVAEAQADGIKIEYAPPVTRDNGDVVYTIRSSGQGLTQLNGFMFSNSAKIQTTTVSGERQITFSYRPTTSIARKNTFTLIGGEIISSNGRKIDEQTVQWVNPTTTMQATLTEAADFPTWLPYTLIGVGAVLIAVSFSGFGLTLFAAFQPKPKPIRRTGTLPRLEPKPPTNMFCPHCGETIPAESTFCPYCGNSTS